MSEKVTGFEKIRQSLDNLKADPQSAVIKALLSMTGVMVLFVGYDEYKEFQNEAIRRNPPEGSVCTIIEDIEDPRYEADVWFEGAQDIVPGLNNMLIVSRRNAVPTLGLNDQPDRVITDYSICDYPGKPYTDGGVRRVVNPDNIDPSVVTVIPESKFPESPSVSN